MLELAEHGVELLGVRCVTNQDNAFRSGMQNPWINCNPRAHQDQSPTLRELAGEGPDNLTADLACIVSGLVAPQRYCGPGMGQ